MKRRSDVIGVFANESSLMRLMGSVLMELNDGYISGRLMHFKKEDISKLEESGEKLREIASQQRALLMAA